MLQIDRITNAIEIQQTSYKLLMWLGREIGNGVINFTNSHSGSSASDNSYSWIQEHYDLLPQELRPPRDRMRAFSNYFGSYITTSFDLIESPGTRLESSCGCYCEFCTHLARASHLRAKKLGKRAKALAGEQRVSRVMRLANEEGMQISDDIAAEIARGQFRRDAAYSAYGQCLLERIEGAECGPYVLALWREIAWKPEGSPIKGFELIASDFLLAECRLIEEIKSHCKAH